MKKKISILILFASLTISPAINAQTSGRIVYEQKTKLNIDIDADNPELMKNIPKEHVSKNELIFDSTSSIYRKVANKNSDAAIESENEHGKMVIKMDEPDEKIYCDLIGKTKTEQRDFMTRKFLIGIPFTSSSWKLTGQQKNILNYPCQEAILQDTARKITAWFTPAIPLSTGPNGLCNLPGMVLSAEYNGGEMTFEAKSVDLGPVDSKQIIRPTEGKKVTRDEFNQMVREKNKEMDEQGEGNGNVIIRIKK